MEENPGLLNFYFFRSSLFECVHKGCIFVHIPLFLMKRILSITLALLLLTSSLHLTVASHICGGSLAQVKWSMDHELGSCGMEGEAEHHPQGITLHEACCQDVVSAWSTDGQYQVSAQTFNAVAPQVLACMEIPSYPIFNNLKLTAVMQVFPPGGCEPSRVELERVCVYRI